MAALSYGEIVPATQSGVDYVMSHLWDRGHEELARLGLTNRQARDRFLGYVDDGVYSGVLMADGVPIFASGISRDDDASCFTWFQATDAFDEHALHITRRVRKQVREHDGDKLYLYSTLVHPQAARWFGAIGFERDHWCRLTTAKWPLFRYVRR